MARYIDANILENKINAYMRNTHDVMYVRGLINETETADVVPVVHAHWNEFSDYTGTCYAECSRCGLLWRIEEGTAEENEMFYCPKCGAKTDEGVE